MKPFNLEAALAGEPVKLSNGNKAFVKFKLSNPYNKDGVQLSGYAIEDGKEVVVNWGVSGRVYPTCKFVNDIIGMWEDPPPTVKISNFEFPKPKTDFQNVDGWYYIPCFDSDLFEMVCLCHSKTDYFFLKNGLVHKTKEAAIQHTKVMLALSQGKTSLDD